MAGKNGLSRNTILAPNMKKARSYFYNYPNKKKKTRMIVDVSKIKKHPTLRGNIYLITHKKRIKGEVARRRRHARASRWKGLFNPEYSR